MPNFASITLIGHLGREPESKYTPDGTAIVGFSMATTRKRRDGEITTWWRCTVFGKRGEALAQYLHKGDPVLVQGEPFVRAYTTKEGEERTSLEIEVREWAFVGGKGDRQQEAPRARPAPEPQADLGDFDDSIPF